jgi:hypothetical protein
LRATVVDAEAARRDRTERGRRNSFATATDGDARPALELRDELAWLVFDYGRPPYRAQNPSDAERMAIIATGGWPRAVRWAPISICCSPVLQADPLG